VTHTSQTEHCCSTNGLHS